MKNDAIKLSDFKRLFLGEAPLEFLIEVSLRFLIVYLIFFFTMRLLGKRMAAQLTMFELIIIITLGAAIALPMESPDKGILPGLLILGFIVFYEKGLSFLTFKSLKIETITQGNASILLKDGRIIMDEMKNTVLSLERLFAELRVLNITHLGEIDRVYLEACGLFSVMKSTKPKAGLSIIPERDRNLIPQLKIVENEYACVKCGNISYSKIIPKEKCQYCNNNEWINAIINKN